MAKEKFHRDQPHVNIGTIGHVDPAQQSDGGSITQYNESRLSFLRLHAARTGFLLVLIVLVIGVLVVVFGKKPTAPANEPPFQPALISEINLPAADITLERGFTANDDLWDWAAQECVPDYTPLALIACLETDTVFPIILGAVYNDADSAICQPVLYAGEQDGDLVQAPPASQSNGEFYTIQLVEGRIASIPRIDPDSASGSDVAIEMIQLSVEQFDTSADAGQVPFILILYDTVLPDGASVQANFGFQVVMASLHSNILMIAPRIDPATDEVIGPTLALIAKPDDPEMPLLVVDLSDPDLPEQGMLLALMKMAPASQLLPPVIPPLCDPLSIAPAEEGTEEPTEETPESNPPVSTEEPVDQPPGVCGDRVCDPNLENSDICPSDCQCVDDGICSPGEGANCQDCGSSAGSCGVVCSDSSQCVAGLSCAGGICWDAVICGGADPGGGSGGGSDSGGGSECTVIRRVEDRDSGCVILYDSCGGVQRVCP